MQLKKKMNSSLINKSKEEEEIVENFENKYEFCCFGPIPEDRPIPMPLFIKHHKNPNFDKHSSNLSFSCECLGKSKMVNHISLFIFVSIPFLNLSIILLCVLCSAVQEVC